VRGERGRKLNRWRSERCERSFAHVCETGGGRRLWLRGLINASKSYLMRCCAHNLGLVLRKCFGLSKPRSGAGFWALLFVGWTLFMAVAKTSKFAAVPLFATVVGAIALSLLSLLAWSSHTSLHHALEKPCS